MNTLNQNQLFEIAECGQQSTLIDWLHENGTNTHKLTMFLTPDEIEDLTDAKCKDKQIQWLMDNGVRFVRSSVGGPKVLHSEIDRVMLGGIVEKRQEPDFKQING